MMRGGRAFAVVAGLLAHALAGAAILSGPELAAAIVPAAIALALAVVSGFTGNVLGRWTLRDAYRGWALSRAGALWTIGIVSAIATFAHYLAGLGVCIPMLAGYLAARDAPRASDLAFLAVAVGVMVAVATHAKAWQESAAFAVPILVLALAFAAREAWDLAHLAAADEGSRAAAGAAFGRFSLVAGAGAAGAVAVGFWLYAGGRADGVPGEGARGILLALIIAGSAGAAWVLARRRNADA